MVDPHVLVRAEELSLQINRLHVSYLQEDESPQKIEQRTKLENFIRKYLCLIAHGRKFIFPETAEVLRCSVAMKNNFSAYRASTAWNAIARYAANLVAQPWRKEFRVIKTFSGFYIHDIEENLVGAERLLDCMGYKRVDHSSLVLEQPIDLDAVISVSRDAIVAFVECQVMKEIWEGVYPQFECSWLEILNFRESHICSPESTIKSLSYLYHQNCFHQQQQQQIMVPPIIPHDAYSTANRIHHHSPQSSCLYGQAVSPQMPYYGYSSYASCPAPPQPRYACVVNPQMMYPMSPAGYHHAKSPIAPANGYHYQHSNQILPSSSGHNGYMVPQASSLPPTYNCVVPTGQLIELDSSTSVGPSSRACRLSTSLVDDDKSVELRNGTGAERSSNFYAEGVIPIRESPTSIRLENKTLRPNTFDDLKPRKNGMHIDVGDESYSHSEKFGASKQPQRQTARKGGAPTAPMQDGTGTWESWDYVYRNLESQGYNKDVGERGDILHSSTFPRRGSVGSAGSSPNINGTVARNSRNVRDTEVSASVEQSSHLSHLTNSIQAMRLNSDSNTYGKGVDAVDSRSGVRDTKKEKIGTKSSSAAPKSVLRDQKKETNALLTSTLKKGQESRAEDEAVNFWECVFCTFHNKNGQCVCEMCGKSRQPGNEDKPLISGGRECPKCTLVNARGVVSCEACHESLKNSPTYI
ncbi:Protein tamozhennic [Frankliniella fusca]|uniref:Protein tamozhennic n=1 Tax=Frankliniella fusca TaxID=407009 RepID=A0AAE1H2V4_9NEOP|nr:Protein tamozhennic [Frankliniella fusca]